MLLCSDCSVVGVITNVIMSSRGQSSLLRFHVNKDHVTIKTGSEVIITWDHHQISNIFFLSSTLHYWNVSTDVIITYSKICKSLNRWFLPLYRIFNDQYIKIPLFDKIIKFWSGVVLCVQKQYRHTCFIHTVWPRDGYIPYGAGFTEWSTIRNAIRQWLFRRFRGNISSFLPLEFNSGTNFCIFLYNTEMMLNFIQ